MTAFASAIKGLNWTRGMIRLWLLVSIVFTVVTVTSEWQQAAENCSSSRARASTLHPECSDFRRLLEGEEGCRQHRQSLSNLTPEAKAKVIAEQKVTADQSCTMDAQAAAKDIAEQIALFIGASVALAISAYIASAVLAWVVRGFRRTETPTAARR